MNEPLSTESLLKRNLADLPTSGVRDGAMVWVSNGRKSGEGASAGTGILAYFNESTLSWLRFRDDAAVTV